jgi:hypothetical protein
LLSFPTQWSVLRFQQVLQSSRGSAGLVEPVFLLEPNAITRELRRKRITVVDYPDGRLAIRYRGLDLPYTTFDKLRQVSQATIVENKHLGAVLSHIRERQIERAEARWSRRS